MQILRIESQQDKALGLVERVTNRTLVIALALRGERFVAEEYRVPLALQKIMQGPGVVYVRRAVTYENIICPAGLFGWPFEIDHVGRYLFAGTPPLEVPLDHRARDGAEIELYGSLVVEGDLVIASQATRSQPVQGGVPKFFQFLARIPISVKVDVVGMEGVAVEQFSNSLDAERPHHLIAPLIVEDFAAQKAGVIVQANERDPIDLNSLILGQNIQKDLPGGLASLAELHIDRIRTFDPLEGDRGTFKICQFGANRDPGGHQSQSGSVLVLQGRLGLVELLDPGGETNRQRQPVLTQI